jgi:hypothetical protein
MARNRSSEPNGHAPITSDTLNRVEALSVGAVNVLTVTVVSALRGMQEIGAEVGATAVSAVRGSIRAAEVIGTDLGRVARNVVGGTVSAGRDVGGDVVRLAKEAADGAIDAADRIGSATVRMVRGVVDEAVGRAGGDARKPPQPARARTAPRAARSRRRVA